MRPLSRSVSLLSAALALLIACAPGCQATKAGLPLGRPKVLPGVRTTTSIGDRPVSVVAGTPGDTYALDTAPLPARDPAEGRVSGRVVDGRGRPVPNAEVRLADGSSPYGRSVRAVTDKAGGFTLRGLRPNRRYTLIAQAGDGRAVLHGRSIVEAPDNDVRVRLAESEPRTAASDSPPDGRLDRVSDRSELEDEREPEPSPRSSSRINPDDLPPAAEAEALDPRSETRGSRTAMTASRSQGWRSAGNEGFDRSESSATEDDRLPAPSRPPRRRSALGLPVEDEDGPNPLPPALEREPASATSGADEPFGQANDRSGFPPVDESRATPPDFPETSSNNRDPAPSHLPGEIAAAAATSDGGREPDVTPASSSPGPVGELSPMPPSTSAETGGPDSSGTAASPALMDPDAPAPIQVPGAVAEPPGSPTPAPAAPAALDSSAPQPGDSPPLGAPPSEEISAPPAGSTPAPGPDPTPNEGQGAPSLDGQAAPASSAEPEPEAAPAEAGPGSPDRPIGSFDGPEAGTPAADASLRAEVAPAARPTWSQLTAQSSMQRAMTYPPSMRRLPTGGSTQGQANSTDAPRGRLGLGLLGNRREQPSAPKADAGEPGVVQATCDYDARRTRVVDFTLPDVQGRPVRFQDLDADFVLIDFWGTWCGPCVKSIPHLVQIQNRYDPKRLRVVGVAYEQGEPGENASTVLRAMRQLAINYSVLLAEQDGKPCPLAGALKVNGYPTLILLDRNGKLLWRQTGASPADLARLDRVVAARTVEGKVRR